MSEVEIIGENGYWNEDDHDAGNDENAPEADAAVASLLARRVRVGVYRVADI